MGQIIATLNKAKLMLPARPSTRDFLSVSGRQREAPESVQIPSAATSSLVTPGKSLPFFEPQGPHLSKGNQTASPVKSGWHSSWHVVGTQELEVRTVMTVPAHTELPSQRFLSERSSVPLVSGNEI